MIKKIILTCDWCSEEHTIEATEEDNYIDLNDSFEQGWYLVEAWFGEKMYCSLRCLSIALNV